MTLVLVHGAGSGPWVFEGWDGDVLAVDLQAGLDPASASMEDYARVLSGACAPLARVAVCGWSMGGLVAMMVAARLDPDALILIEPSPPAELQGRAEVADATGTFDPEDVYGAFPPGIRARPESSRARADRKRGIAVPTLPERTLVVYGDEFEDDRGRALARFYGADEAHFPGLSHWDLVLSPEVRDVVVRYANERRPPGGRPPPV